MKICIFTRDTIILYRVTHSHSTVSYVHTTQYTVSVHLSYTRYTHTHTQNLQCKTNRKSSSQIVSCFFPCFFSASRVSVISVSSSSYSIIILYVQYWLILINTCCTCIDTVLYYHNCSTVLLGKFIEIDCLFPISTKSPKKTGLRRLGGTPPDPPTSLLANHFSMLG